VSADAIVTAAVLVIGDEILSGRTKDANIAVIAAHLTSIGIDLCEVRIVGDNEADIVAAVNALRATPTSSRPAASARRTTTSPPTASARHLACRWTLIREPSPS
jgi:phosphoglycolate phosphatase-like HAD superfamily hydrolase